MPNKAERDAVVEAADAQARFLRLRCPCCEMRAEIVSVPTSGNDWFKVRCARCYLQTGEYPEPYQAVEVWNTRPSSQNAELRERVRALETENEKFRQAIGEMVIDKVADEIVKERAK